VNYLGQGALVIGKRQGGRKTRFFLMFPDWALLPMVALATVATRDRKPGRHHGRVFADPAGHSARPVAALLKFAIRRRRIPARSTFRASTSCC